VVFADTSFFVAVLRTSDSRHGEAARLADIYGDEPICTSTFVLAECWTLLRRRLHHRAAFAWLDKTVAEPNTRIEQVTSELQDEAWAWLRVHDERPYSFVDATSFALMHWLRIREALAFDGDFAAAGFVELRA
jgi:uncharacterized protein